MPESSNVSHSRVSPKKVEAPDVEELVTSLPASPVDEENRIEQSISAELREAEAKAAKLISSDDSRLNWTNSRQTIEEFRPVPWYIWRIVNYVLSRAGQVRKFDHGMVFALKKLLILAARDPDIVENGSSIKQSEEAVRLLPPDVFTACAVIHAVGRRLKTRKFERVWQPILEEALLRTRIGYSLGRHIVNFGAGRGMLAGFAGRAGLAIQIATGTLDQANATIGQIARGGSVQRIGREVYQAEPLQVSAMMLIASGCGRDAAYGLMAVAAPELIMATELSEEQKRWRTVFLILEEIRFGNLSKIPDEYWHSLGLNTATEITAIQNEIHQVTRRGHSWGWMVE